MLVDMHRLRSFTYPNYGQHKYCSIACTVSIVNRHQLLCNAHSLPSKRKETGITSSCNMLLINTIFTIIKRGSQNKKKTLVCQYRRRVSKSVCHMWSLPTRSFFSKFCRVLISAWDNVSSVYHHQVLSTKAEAANEASVVNERNCRF